MDRSSQQPWIIYRVNYWCCNGFYIGETKRRLHDRKTEHFKALAKNDHTPAIADHDKATGRNIKWDHFDSLAKGKNYYRCKIRDLIYSRTWATCQNQHESEKISVALLIYSTF